MASHSFFLGRPDWEVESQHNERAGFYKELHLYKEGVKIDMPLLFMQAHM